MPRDKWTFPQWNARSPFFFLTFSSSVFQVREGMAVANHRKKFNVLRGDYFEAVMLSTQPHAGRRPEMGV